MTASLAPRASRPMAPSRRFGLALGCALAGCAVLAAWAATDDAPASPAPLAMATGPVLLPRGPLLDRVLDDVRASPTQRAQVHQILDAADADLRAGRAAARADGDQMLRLFTQPVVDAAAVEAVRARMAQRREAESHRMTQAMVDLGPVLVPDQRRQIVNQFARLDPRALPGVRPQLPAARQ